MANDLVNQDRNKASIKTQRLGSGSLGAGEQVETGKSGVPTEGREAPDPLPSPHPTYLFTSFLILTMHHSL